MSTKVQEAFRIQHIQDQKSNSPQHILIKHEMHKTKEGYREQERKIQSHIEAGPSD